MFDARIDITSFQIYKEDLHLNRFLLHGADIVTRLHLKGILLLSMVILDPMMELLQTFQL